MKNRNIPFFILLLINIFVLSLISLVNSELSRWGISIFLPGLFFLSSSILLNWWQGILGCTIIGLFLDSVYHTPFGFLGFTLPLLCLAGKRWLKNTSNNRPWRSVLFQVITNIGTAFFLLAVLFIQDLSFNKFNFTRLITDLILSSILLIPLCIWLLEFTIIVIEKVSGKNVIKEGELWTLQKNITPKIEDIMCLEFFILYYS